MHNPRKSQPFFVDLDNVLGDFDRAAAEIHGWDYAELKRAHRNGEWGLLDTLRVTLDEFWEPIHRAGESFWINMEPLPWALDLLNLLEGKDWYIVSGPSREISSYTGKLKWIERYLSPRYLGRCFLTHHKHLLGYNPDAVLIDDRELNVDKFIACGGQGIIFPSRGNSLHSLGDDPMPHVSSMVELRVKTYNTQQRQKELA